MGGKEEILRLCMALSIGYHKGLTVMSARCLSKAVGKDSFVPQSRIIAR